MEVNVDLDCYGGDIPTDVMEHIFSFCELTHENPRDVYVAFMGKEEKLERNIKPGLYRVRGCKTLGDVKRRFEFWNKPYWRGRGLQQVDRLCCAAEFHEDTHPIQENDETYVGVSFNLEYNEVDVWAPRDMRWKKYLRGNDTLIFEDTGYGKKK